MKVVLTADVENLGHKGDVKEVADGYARNFLLPRRLATAATPAQLKQLKAQADAQARRDARLEGDHRALAARIDAAEVHLNARSGEQGRLYGSITNADVADGLSKVLGLTIDKRQVDLVEPIKQAGTHKVKVRVARGIEGSASVIVAAEQA